MKSELKEIVDCGKMKSANGGDMASTWIAKPQVHAEVQNTS